MANPEMRQVGWYCENPGPGRHEHKNVRSPVGGGSGNVTRSLHFEPQCPKAVPVFVLDAPVDDADG